MSSVDANSRYNYAELVASRDANGTLLEPLHYGIRPSLARVNFSDSTNYLPQDGDNWKKIAWQKLGDPYAWWAAADFSLTVDPWSELLPEITFTYVCGLIADLPAGTTNQARLSKTKGIVHGENLRIENLDPFNLVQQDIAVLTVNHATRYVTFTPVVLAAPVPSITSRITKRVATVPKLIIPSMHQYQFSCTEFTNPLNTLPAD